MSAARHLRESLDLGNRFRVSILKRKRGLYIYIYHQISKNYIYTPCTFARNAAARIGPATNARATDVHFMGRHVVSVQWRRVWFFPGNFGLFNRDPISDSACRVRLSAQFSRFSLFFREKRSSPFRFAFFLPRRFISSLRLLFCSACAALFRLILSSFHYPLFLSPPQNSLLFSSVSTFRKWRDCLSASLASALIDIAFPSITLFIARYSSNSNANQL